MAILGLFGIVLLALFQNVGRLSQDETAMNQANKRTTKKLVMPEYFLSIYEAKKHGDFPVTQEDYEGWLHDTPLYKRLIQEITIKGGSKGCDPSDPNVICPASEQGVAEKERMTLKFDPARTEAQILLYQTWKGRINYSSPALGPHIEMSRAISSSSELKFQFTQRDSASKVSVDINW